VQPALDGRSPNGTLGLNYRVSSVTLRSSDLDGNSAVDHRHWISFDRHHARRRDHFSGADIELPVMEIAFDDVAFDIDFR
jgi:hypothetical protein